MEDLVLGMRVYRQVHILGARVRSEDSGTFYLQKKVKILYVVYVYALRHV